MAVDLSTLSPDTQAAASELFALAKDAGMTLVATSGRRTCAEQAWIYAEGRTRDGTIHTDARGCQSWHVVGRAFDVDIVKGPKDWQKLGALGRSLGLIWGGDFKTSAHLQDYGHFEYHPGITLADICPDPDACVDGKAYPLPGSGVPSPPSSDWLVTGASAKAPGGCGGPRVRLHEDGRAEVEGMGFPTTALPQWVEKFRDLIYPAAEKAGLPPHLVAAFAAVEGSRGYPNACSGSGNGRCDGPCELCHCIAYGVMQLTLPTAAMLNDGKALSSCELFNPELNIALGCKLLRKLFDRYHGNIVNMAFAYNAGDLYCGPGHRRVSCDPATETCLTDKQGKPYKSEACLPANGFNLVADCRASGTFDYGLAVVSFMNGALPKWRANARDVLPPFVPPYIQKPVTEIVRGAQTIAYRSPVATILTLGAIIGVIGGAAIAFSRGSENAAGGRAHQRVDARNSRPRNTRARL
jgi:hypothetical protein